MKTEIIKTESFHHRKELDPELENGLNEIEKMDFKGSFYSEGHGKIFQFFKSPFIYVNQN